MDVTPSRRQALATLGVVAGALVAEQALLSGSGGATPQASASAAPYPGGYAPDGTAGRTAALPLNSVQLLDSPFRANQARNTSYLLFLEPERMLRSFRLNYGQRSSAEPLGGWEKPLSQIRGHTTGHLLSGLALTYASTGNTAARDRGRYLVTQLARLQARATGAGFHRGYLSAFPEGYFGVLEQGRSIWSPYYMIHKYLAGLIDQYQLAGDGQALDVATQLGDWVDWRTGRLSYDQMQMVLQTEFGGLPEALANLYTITGAERYLATAQRFYHAAVLDPLADGVDALPGLQANVTTPKIIACVRMCEETGSPGDRDIARNFWDIVTGHHGYVIGGAGNYEHFQPPDVVAAQLSNFTCENCVSYNLYVNLFIPSQVSAHGLVLRQATGFPDDPVIRLSVLSGSATITLRVRVPRWIAARPRVVLNGVPLGGTAAAPGWLTIRRRWQAGDRLAVTLPMRLTAEPTPDHPSVPALTYGPVVLTGVYAADPGPLTPRLSLTSVRPPPPSPWPSRRRPAPGRSG